MYITTANRNSIKYRNKLQRLYAKWPLTYEKEFKQYRNILTKIIRAAKKICYKCKLSQETGNTKKVWQTVNHLIGKDHTKLLLL